MNRFWSRYLQPPKLDTTTPIDSWRIHLAGVVCLIGYIALASYSTGYLGDPQLYAFFAAIAWVSVPVVAVFIATGAKGMSIGFHAVLFWAILFRMCGILGEPLFEDDYYRYLWDGYRFAQEGTPYASTPASFFSDDSIPQTFQRILDHVNYPDIPTIYGPTSQILFLTSYALNPGSLVPLKVLLIAFDLILIWLMRNEAAPRYILLYAWCPLVIKEIAFTAHPDIVGITFLFGSLLLLKRGNPSWSALCLACAIGAKVFAVVLLPFVLFNKDVRSKFVFVGALGLLYLPFVVQGATELTALMIFAKEWVFNASLYGLFTVWFDPLQTRVMLASVFIVYWVVYLLRYFNSELRPVPRGDWIFLVFLLVAPAVNPWYVLWILPFAVLYPSLWAWTFAYSVMLSYVTWINLGNIELDPFDHPAWVKPLEYGLVALALIAGWARHRFGTFSGTKRKPTPEVVDRL